MTRKEILDAALKCVCGDRERDYGSPRKNFTVAAKLCGAYLGIEITPDDVAVLLALIKISRIQRGEGVKDDTYIDLAGYAAIAGELAGERRDEDTALMITGPTI